MKIYDCLIIGGGFAGLAAGIYLGRFMRSALIIDSQDGRWNTHETNQNYLGFPKGIKAKKLRYLALEQALHFGAILKNDKIINIQKRRTIFLAEGNKGRHKGKTLILATGVKDLLPKFPHWQRFWGRSFFWCITCDGYKTRGKKVMIVGNDDDAGITTMQFLNFTNKITFITNCPVGQINLSKKWINNLNLANISIFEGEIKEVLGKNGMMEKVILEDGRQINTDFMFNQQESRPNSDLAQKLGVKVDEKGYILTNDEQRTNLTCFYAAGDVTKPFSHQVITAAHEGATAAEAANYDLYLPNQRY